MDVLEQNACLLTCVCQPAHLATLTRRSCRFLTPLHLENSLTLPRRLYALCPHVYTQRIAIKLSLQYHFSQCLRKQRCSA